jgi:triacylglycerol lipase
MAFGQLRLGPVRFSNFRRIHQAIAARGHPLLLASVHPTASIERRAQMLKRGIEGFLRRLEQPEERLIIFAHSMGGLDCRHMITHLGMDRHIAALITVCCPHRGSTYANWAIENVCDRFGARRLVELLQLDINALDDLTVEACEQFNRRTPDMPGVRYYSISGARPRLLLQPFYYHSWRIIAEKEGDNDGLVSVRSAIWGEHLGTWPVDHLHAVNRRIVPELIERTGDVTARYLQVLERVQRDLERSPSESAASARSG